MPDYQNVSYKLNLPTDGKVTFEVFGLAGISEIGLIGSEIDTNGVESLYGDDNLDIHNQNKQSIVSVERSGRFKGWLINNLWANGFKKGIYLLFCNRFCPHFKDIKNRKVFLPYRA